MSDQCPICMEPLESDLGKLPCDHVFHRKCLKGLDRLECPLCRDEFRPDEIKKIDKIPPARKIKMPETGAELYRISKGRIINKKYLEDQPLSDTPGYTYLSAPERKIFEDLANQGGRRRKTRRRRSTRKTRNVRK